MSRLVEELKVDHFHIRQVLGRVKDRNLTTSERFEIFITAKALLLSHLDKENQELYPVLRYAAQIDPQSQSTLETFEKDMLGIASQATGFFCKYASLDTVNSEIEADPNYAVELARSLETLTTLLGRRLGLEELSLYPVYDCIVGKGSRLAVELQVQDDIGGARLIHIPIDKMA